METKVIRDENEINALTHRIIGCAMVVHGTLGNGFQEVIYQSASHQLLRSLPYCRRSVAQLWNNKFGFQTGL